MIARVTIVLLAAASLLAACGGKQTESTEQPSADESSSPARLTDGVEELEVDGVRVLVKHKDGAELLTAGVYFDGGAPYWNPELAGAERLALSVATTAGPDGIAKEDYQAALDRVGAIVGASSGPDFAQARLSALSTTVDSVWPLFVETLLNPGFPEEEIELARERQLTTIRTRMDSPDSAVVETAQQLAFRGHPYAVREEGEEETVSGLDETQLREAMGRLFVKERMLVVFVGDIDASEATDLVRSAFSELPSNPTWEDDLRVSGETHLAYEEAEISILERPDLPTNYIIGYFTAPAYDDADYPAMLIGSKLLRERLFEEVRTKRNLTYAVSSGIGSRRDNIGYLYVTATDPETTLGVMYDTINEMVSTPPSEQDLHNQVLVFLTDYYLDLQSPSAQASTLAEWELLGPGWEAADELNESLRALTPAELSATLDRHIQNIRFGIVGDPEEIPVELFTSR